MNGLSDQEREALCICAEFAYLLDSDSVKEICTAREALVNEIADARVKAALEAAADQIDGWREMAIWAASHTEDPDQAQNSQIRALAYRRADRIVRAAVPQTSRPPAVESQPRE